MVEFEFMKMVCEDMSKRDISHDQAFIIAGLTEGDNHKCGHRLIFSSANIPQFIMLLSMLIDTYCTDTKSDPAKILDGVAMALDVLNTDYEGGSLDNK